MDQKNLNIIEANCELNLIDDNKLKSLLKPEQLLRLGYRLKDID